MKRNILKSMLIATLLGAASLASKFNTNVSAPIVGNVPAPASKRRFRTGIKGMASSNFTRYGRGLQNQFDRANTRMNEHGVMVKA